MCLSESPESFAASPPGKSFSSSVTGEEWGTDDTRTRVAIIPDIYGCSPFYRGLAARYADRGCRAFLINPFEAFGDLAEPTRELAFERRHRMQDREFVDAFECFCREQSVTAVIGFCLGGFYVFELARRGVPASLIGLYGFPQGMANQDPLLVPFDYLPDITTPFTMLMGADDHAVGEDVIKQLIEAADDAPAMTLKVYEGVGHNFLAFLDDDDPARKEVARDALRRIDTAILAPVGEAF